MYLRTGKAPIHGKRKSAGKGEVYCVECERVVKRMASDETKYSMHKTAPDIPCMPKCSNAGKEIEELCVL